MKIRSLAAMLCAAAIMMSSSVATAAYVSTNVSLHGTSPVSTNDNGPGPPLVHLQMMGFGDGQLWTNQVNGLPLAVGSTVRTVGAINVADVTNGQNFPFLLPDNSPIHAIFAIEGVISATGQADFSGGSLWFASRTTENTGFTISAPTDPLSWNFDDVYAKYDLLPADTIIPGTTQGINPAYPSGFPASDVNSSNVGGIFGTGEGLFVFQEDTGFTPAAGFTNPGLGGFTGANWMYDAEQGSGFEGIAALTDQTVQATPVGLTGAQLALLDTISLAASGFTGAFSEGGFAPAGDPSATGDFSAQLSSEAFFITQQQAAVIPEPSSLAIFALLGCGVAVRYGRKRLVKTA